MSGVDKVLKVLTHTVHSDVTESHCRALEMEQIDDFHSTALLQSFKIQPLGFIIDFYQDGMYFDVFCQVDAGLDRFRRTGSKYCLRMNPLLLVAGSFGTAEIFWTFREKEKKLFMKSRAS